MGSSAFVRGDGYGCVRGSGLGGFRGGGWDQVGVGRLCCFVDFFFSCCGLWLPKWW